MRIDWQQLWDEFDDWAQEDRSKHCGKCGHTERNYPEWEDQQKKIEKLVSRALKEKA